MSKLSDSLSGDGLLSSAMVGSLLQKPDLPRECMRAVEDCYRLTVCLGSPRLKAWRDTAQGGQSNFRHFVVRAVPSRLVFLR